MMSLLHAWGANSHGQLGLGYESEQELVPQQLRELPFDKDDIKLIVGGGGHVIILLNNGQLFSCGWNHKGQLGIDSTSDQTTFQEIKEVPEDIISLTCGWDTSAAVTKSGGLYVWGCNLYFSLPSVKNSKALMVPTKLELPNNESAVKVAIEFNYINVLTDRRTVFRLKKRRNMSELPNNFEKVEQSNIFDIAAGQNHLIMVQLLKNRIIGLGDNKFGQGGIVPIHSNIPKKLVCGWKHNAYLDELGRLYLWGRNNYGQLGYYPDSHNMPQSQQETEPLAYKTTGEEIVDVHLGSEHCLAIGKSGAVYTWGWNEHGNCGNGSTENVYTNFKHNFDGKCCKAGCGAGFCYALIESSSVL